MKVFQVVSERCEDDDKITEVVQYAASEDDSIQTVFNYYLNLCPQVDEELKSIREVLTVSNIIEPEKEQ